MFFTLGDESLHWGAQQKRGDVFGSLKGTENGYRGAAAGASGFDSIDCRTRERTHGGFRSVRRRCVPLLLPTSCCRCRGIGIGIQMIFLVISRVSHLTPPVPSRPVLYDVGADEGSRSSNVCFYVGSLELREQ